MILKIEKFKTAAWEKAGKYDAGHNRHVLLAMLIGIGTIAWWLIRFIGVALNANLADDKKNKWSFLCPQEKQAEQEENEKDWLGRKPGQPFYRMPMPDVQVLEEMDKK